MVVVVVVVVVVERRQSSLSLSLVAELTVVVAVVVVLFLPSPSPVLLVQHPCLVTCLPRTSLCTCGCDYSMSLNVAWWSLACRCFRMGVVSEMLTVLSMLQSCRAGGSRNTIM